jgi:hypothetical protein
VPGPTDDYFTYKRWFEAAHELLVLPTDCVEADGPAWVYSNQYTWNLNWYLVFSNPAAYIRIAEGFAKRSRLSFSRRIYFAFHFGPLIASNPDGIPVHDSSDPVFVRVDNAGGRAAHLHHEGDPKTHIPQEKISGLVLDDIDPFQFIKASVRARQKRTPVARELGYSII